MSETRSEQAYWNGEPCEARRVRVVVGKSQLPTWWCAKLEGTERAAVEVTYYGEKFYLDNENGSGWLKVTKGRGSPHLGHSSLPVDRVVESPDAAPPPTPRRLVSTPQEPALGGKGSQKRHRAALRKARP